MKKQFSNIFVAVFILGVILLIIVPLSPPFLDIMLIVNISLSLLIMLVALFARETLNFSTFPTMLLIVTIFRLGLNIASTRLILSNGGQAGGVIHTFGSFVGSGNLVVGFIIFLIIVVVQFIVITRGAERVAEVAARFTLDAMPGKQMAIDADLNAGVIDENEARDRRQNIQREAQFYGSMDGASKFVKGDAIVGILITVINIVGGIIIGLLGVGGTTMTFDKVLETYTIATIGEGLAAQLPALMVSTGTGIIVTRSATEKGFGKDLMSQLFSQPSILVLLGVLLVVLSFVPGLPWLPLILLGITLPIVATVIRNRRKKAEATEMVDTAEAQAQEKRKPESVTSLLQVDLIEMEFGYGIIPLVDASQGGDLLDRVVMIRRQCAMDLGTIVPVVRLRDNIQLSTNEYCIKIKGLEVARGEVLLDHFLALKPTDTEDSIEGIETVEPAFGLPALWIPEAERERAELKGYTTIDPPSVIATHLMEIIKRHAHELLGRQQVQVLIENLKRQQPTLVDEVVPKMFSLGEVQKVLANLLKENVSIRDLGSILEVMGDNGSITRDPDLLTEYVRQSMKRAISRRFIPAGRARVITLDPGLEQVIAENVRQSERGAYVALEPALTQKILLKLKTSVERLISTGSSPIVLTSPSVRKHFKRMTEQVAPELIVLSFNELEQNVEILSEGVVSI